MGKVNLISICKPKQWKTIPVADLKDKGYPVYGANGIIGYYDSYNHEEETIAITCRGATCGTVNLTQPKSYITGNAMCLDCVDSDVKTKYLFYAMKAYDFDKIISGTAQPQITREGLGKVQITLPPISMQEKIICILDKVMLLIAKRRRQLALLDTLTQSRFVEMFGTWPQNNKNWEIGTIKDVVSEVRYGSSRPAVVGGKYPYLRMNNITYTGGLDLTDIKYIDIPDNELDKCTVRKGDVLFNRTNSRELVGKTCVYDRDDMMVLAGFVIRVRVNERVTPLFLSAFLNTDFSKHMLFNMCKNAIGQANINAKELQGIGIYIPPISLQNEFVEFVSEVDRQKAALRRSLTALTTLKSALLQEYFGE